MLRQQTFCEVLAEVRWLSSVKSVTLKRDNEQEERPAPLERTTSGVPWGVGGKTQTVCKHHIIRYNLPSQAILQRIYLL